MSIKVAFASGDRGEFGYQGGLPWEGHPLQSKDFKAFKEFTKDCVIVMGRLTFESLPFKLPNRVNVVLSNTSFTIKAKNGDEPDVVCSNGIDLKSFYESLENTYEKDVCVIGGASLILKTIPIAHKIMRTIFEGTYEADVVLPLLPKYLGEVCKVEAYADEPSDKRLTIFYYQKD